jgi:hypothetical protein
MSVSHFNEIWGQSARQRQGAGTALLRTGQDNPSEPSAGAARAL